MIVLATIAAIAALAVGQDPENDSSVQGNAWSQGNTAVPWGTGEFVIASVNLPGLPAIFDCVSVPFG